MSTALAFSALLMGLAGGPHCVAMCGAACGGLARMGAAPVRLHPSSSAQGEAAGALPSSSGAQPSSLRAQLSSLRPQWMFQLGRLTGYATAGAAAAFAVENFAWLANSTSALRPVWTLFHLAVLAWGLMLLAQARQPMWVSSAGRGVWTRVRPLASARGGLFVTGALWAFMPCGLLYSALLVASLSGGALAGALSMALFALGSGLSLTLAPRLFARLRQAGNQLRQDWGTRIAGALLVLVALWALWADMAHRIAVWCGLA